jgi:AcrR family transcriptional regulator
MMRDLPPPPATRKARATYDSIVEATRSELRHRTLSPEAIAERARVSPATFYTYFSSKDEVLAVALHAALSERFERLHAVLSIEELLDHGLPAVAESIVEETVASYRRDAGTIQLAIIRSEESKAIEGVLRHWSTTTLDELRRFIGLGQRAGQLRDGDVDRMATAMLISLQGYKSPLLLESSDDALVGELASMLTTLLRPEPTIG